jgi:hypothetical protein
MHPNELEAGLDDLQSKLVPLERLLGALEASLPKPLFYDSAQDHYGYRYGAPDARHFCVLKGVRAVSGLNACIQLARQGFTQEIGVLVRTIAECCAQIDFVLPVMPGKEKVRQEAARFLEEYFADYKRNAASDVGKLSVRQRQVHEIIGADLDRFAQLDTGSLPADRIPASRLFQNAYSIFSNYVHARYPEVMDMYGGEPGHFHQRGMKGTSKDGETLQIIEAFIETVSLALKSIVQRLDLKALVNSDETLQQWYRNRQFRPESRPLP